MKKNILLMILMLFLIANMFLVTACEENQIDINSASLSELDELSGIGETIAQYIIDARPFDSVDNLIDVYKIGDVTLKKIKEQGLACVGDVEEEITSEDEEENEEIAEVAEDVGDKLEKPAEIPKPVEREVISLNAQTIKSEETEESLGKNNYVVYGLIGFCVLIGLLFWLKQRKPKNEFRE